jgi:hypothetical protein
LIFTTHDINLLSNQFFRLDQIWFVEKNKYSYTDLYSLVEYKIDENNSLAKDYLKGKFGGVPYLAKLQNLFENNE